MESETHCWLRRMLKCKRCCAFHRYMLHLYSELVNSCWNEAMTNLLRKSIHHEFAEQAWRHASTPEADASNASTNNPVFAVNVYLFQVWLFTTIQKLLPSNYGPFWRYLVERFGHTSIDDVCPEIRKNHAYGEHLPITYGQDPFDAEFKTMWEMLVSPAFVPSDALFGPGFTDSMHPTMRYEPPDDATGYWPTTPPLANIFAMMKKQSAMDFTKGKNYISQVDSFLQFNGSLAYKSPFHHIRSDGTKLFYWPHKRNSLIHRTSLPCPLPDNKYADLFHIINTQYDLFDNCKQIAGAVKSITPENVDEILGFVTEEMFSKSVVFPAHVILPSANAKENEGHLWKEMYFDDKVHMISREGCFSANGSVLKTLCRFSEESEESEEESNVDQNKYVFGGLTAKEMMDVHVDFRPDHVGLQMVKNVNNQFVLREIVKEDLSQKPAASNSVTAAVTGTLPETPDGTSATAASKSATAAVTGTVPETPDGTSATAASKSAITDLDSLKLSEFVDECALILEAVDGKICL